MTHTFFTYLFDESPPFQEIEDTFARAMLAVEKLRGRARSVYIWAEGIFTLDEPHRTCTINASTDVGRDLTASLPTSLL